MCWDKPFTEKKPSKMLQCKVTVSNERRVTAVEDFPEGNRVSSCSCCRGCWMTGGRRWRWSVPRVRGSPPQLTLWTGRRSRPNSRAWQRGGLSFWTKLKPGTCRSKTIQPPVHGMRSHPASSHAISACVHHPGFGLMCGNYWYFAAS